MESPLVAIYCLLNFIIHRAAVMDSEETTSDFLAAYFKVKIDSLYLLIDIFKENSYREC